MKLRAVVNVGIEYLLQKIAAGRDMEFDVVKKTVDRQGKAAFYVAGKVRCFSNQRPGTSEMVVMDADYLNVNEERERFWKELINDPEELERWISTKHLDKNDKSLVKKALQLGFVLPTGKNNAAPRSRLRNFIHDKTLLA